MKFKDYFITVLALCSVHSVSFAQRDWELKLEKSGIKIYTKNLDSTAVKAVKTACIIKTSMTTLTAVLLDINKSGEWMYAIKSASVIEQLSPSEVIYYSEVRLPWPMSNRDYIVDFLISQDTITKMVTATSINKPDMLARYKNIVRIEHSWSQWLISPLPDGRLSVEYELQVDPGGNIPAWLTNLFATSGPFYSFQKLREQVKKPEYKDVSLSFIKD